MNDPVYIFMSGNLSEGYMAHGPYPSLGEVAAAHEGEEGWIMTLNKPKTSI
jgi:hypothetical protein